VTRQSVYENGGRKWLSRFNNSLMKALKEVYPQHDWSRRSRQRPSGYWDSHQHRVQFVKKLEKDLNIKQVDDWNKINVQMVKDLGGGGWLKK
jgi:hypothetical protein